MLNFYDMEGFMNRHDRDLSRFKRMRQVLRGDHLDKTTYRHQHIDNLSYHEYHFKLLDDDFLSKIKLPLVFRRP